MSTDDPRAVAAAFNNAEWCDLVCRTHGAVTAFTAGAWVSETRSPPAYPDAVTLHRSVLPDELGATPAWRVVEGVDELEAWATAHPAGAVFRPELLDDPRVAAVFLPGDADGSVAAGAVGNRSGLAAAHRAGFGSAGALRVWLRMERDGTPRT
jgi:hypothetical protein